MPVKFVILKKSLTLLGPGDFEFHQGRGGGVALWPPLRNQSSTQGKELKLGQVLGLDEISSYGSFQRYDVIGYRFMTILRTRLSNIC